MKVAFARCCRVVILILLWVAIAFAEELSIPEGMVAIPKGNVEHSSKNINVLSFYMDKYETTQIIYEQVIGENPSFFKGSGKPVERVNWFEAKTFCQSTGKRLPTEWEWERSAQLGNKVKLSKKMAKTLGWFKDNSELMTHPVGQKKQNLYGLYDMTGNVWEWTSSDHENGGKVMRGGSWRNSHNSMRPSKRIMSLPLYRYHYVGFRCATSMDPEPDK
ncbi:MAG: SUMF1/EgtB/PvdO family nonheme iron enzyme [Nitrospinaceae bacterium]|nr:SUMF1/EgtB/PvdO family nonheme iron enzyme [Nitrospinaceae bacterium]